jgi:hypothetical protein
MIRAYGLEGYNYLPKMSEKIKVFGVKTGKQKSQGEMLGTLFAVGVIPPGG